MSAPAELKVLCHQLTTTPVAQLPQITPSLLRNISRCGGPLSAASGNAQKSNANETTLLVHKLKTHVSTLLHGRTIEGRFAAVVLVKWIVDTGGWEALRGAESWVRGLLAILGKQDPAASKKLAIITLSTIYQKTHQYQSLVREITTPTLPTFVQSCLALISTKGGKVFAVNASLSKCIFDAFATLMPRHPTIFRPFATQIRIVTKAYAGSTSADIGFVPESVNESARSLAVILHQTAPKNTSGDEWSKSVRELINEMHVTADQVFRAVIEDWESVVGYVSQTINPAEECQGGGSTKEAYPAWTGIDAGVERLVGLLSYLSAHLKHHSANAVTVPLTHIEDLLGRLMSVGPPLPGSTAQSSGLRLHPGIEREEREGLFAGLPSIQSGVMNIYIALVGRLGSNYTFACQSALEHITWAFKASKEDSKFREAAFQTTAALLPLCGLSLPKNSVDRLTPIIVACCKELRPQVDQSAAVTTTKDANGKATPAVNANADKFLSNKPILSDTAAMDTPVVVAARALLPLLLSNLPQHLMEAYVRAEVDRTAILSHHKDAMLASVLHPYIGKNGKSLPSILPHLSRAFPRDAAVEALIRPRLPVIRQAAPLLSEEGLEEREEDEDLVMSDLQDGPARLDTSMVDIDTIATSTTIDGSLNLDEACGVAQSTTETLVTSVNHWGTGTANQANAIAPRITAGAAKPSTGMTSVNITPSAPVSAAPASGRTTAAPAVAAAQESDDDSDDESVHLNAELSGSEDEEE